MMEDGEIESSWTEYYDSEQGFWYLYNAETGESKWRDDAISNDPNDDPNYDEKKEANTSLLKDRKPRKQKKRSMFQKFIVDKKTSESHSASEANIDVIERSRSTMCCYCFYHFFNAIFIETPLILVESILRVIFISIIWVMVLGRTLLTQGTTFSNQSQRRTYMYSREIAISLSATLSLSIPGIILFAYRKYKVYDDWELSPIPTILGAADTRRFCTIVFGGGALASNVDTIRQDPSQEGSSQDYLCCFGANITREQDSDSTNIDSNSPASSLAPGGGGGGGGGTMLMVPKEILHDLRVFLQGDRDSIDSLHLVL